MSIVLQKEYAYPVAAVVSTFYLLVFQTVNVGRARKAAKIDYPQVYAEKSELGDNKAALAFNCAQRAHQNTLEQWPVVVGGTLIAGLANPVAAATLCGTWVFTRVLYTIGYSSGNARKRNMFGASAVGTLCVAGLIGTATVNAVSLIRSL